MGERITAPFTAEQVAALNAYQRGGWMHPFTCGGDRDDDAHERHAAEHGERPGLLVAAEDGWRCPACAYRQTWAHAFMTLPAPDWFARAKAAAQTGREG